VTRPHSSKLRWLLTYPLIVAGCLGCAASQAEPVGDPEQQSDAEYDLGRDAWLRQGKPREGLAHVLTALEKNPENSEAHHLAALIYLNLCQAGGDACRLPDAELHARRALELRSDFREARNTLGVVLIHSKRPADALLVLQPLTEDILYTTPENAYGNLGWAFLELGRLDEAKDALERAVAAQPRFCVGFYRLGLIHERKSQLEAAREAFSRALAADPKCGGLQEALAGRARTWLALGRPEQARADLELCVRLAQDSTAGKDCGSILRKLK